MRNAVAILTLIGILSANAKADSCAQGLLKDGTDGFIAYVGQLLEQRKIGEVELQRLIDGIEARNEITNPAHHEDSSSGIVFTTTADQIHHQEFEEYIHNSQLEQAKILAWAKSALSRSTQDQGRRDKARAETEHPYFNMVFQRVEGGRFIMRKGPKVKAKVTLTNAIEVMTTKVTQYMWFVEMGANPSDIESDDEFVTLNNKNGKPVKILPDYPVENLTWWSAIVFANKLSEKQGLKPAYDLSEVKFKKGTKAENGTLTAISGDVKINAANGDIYQAEGFRLPTEVEQVYLLTNRGRSRTDYFSGVNAKNLEKYAWYEKNSETPRHPVAELRPMIIDGKSFYDLYGIVGEWSTNWKITTPKSGCNPQGPSSGERRGARGGCYCSDEKMLRAQGDAKLDAAEPNEQSCETGLRLVRSVK